MSDLSMTTPDAPAPESSSSPSPPSSSRNIDWRVRPATLDDRDAVRALLQHSYATLLAPDYDADLLHRALPLITEPQPELLTSGTWYVVEAPSSKTPEASVSSSSSNVVVGCGGWSWRRPGGAMSSTTAAEKEPSTHTPVVGAEAHLRHFATDPHWARRGIGRALWERCWRDLVAAHDGLEDIALEVYSTRTAEAFYASLGFRTLQAVDIPLQPDCLFPSILMTRPPSSSSSGPTAPE